jgi:cellobiose epimerase
MDNHSRQRFADQARKELVEGILPFWMNHVVDREKGGFYARVNRDLSMREREPKSLILHTRLLWTFSAAFRTLQKSEYLDLARRAFHFIQKHFWDAEFGGMYWFLDENNRVIDSSKKIYGQAFAIYAFCEYYRIVNDPQVLNRAVDLFRLIEQHTFDQTYTGYCEATLRDWSPALDLRLSDVDMNEKKSMNTHLHVMEAYANLLRVWPDANARDQLGKIIHNFTDHILDSQTWHLRLFFDEAWQCKSRVASFGHDIEAAWLLYEAAEIYGDPVLLEQVRQASVNMADRILHEAVDREGGVYNERKADGSLDKELIWWPQAEAVVGFLNAYQLSGQTHFYQAARRTWDFCMTHLRDGQYGEWFYQIGPDYRPDLSMPKVSEWKCPYHNSRACMEVMHRLQG